MNNAQFWGLFILLIPLLFAWAVRSDPPGNMIIGGVVLMYAGYVGAALLPLLGIVPATGLFIGGALLVGMGGALSAIIARLDAVPGRTAQEIDRILTERAGQRAGPADVEQQAPQQEPAPIQQFKYGRLAIEEFDDGSYTVQGPDMKLRRFRSKQSLDKFLQGQSR